MNIPKESWEHFGSAGHFCASSLCRFHLTTKVGQFLVSTVGEYFPRNRGAQETVGAKMYETMVFEITGECPCGCELPDHSGSEIASDAYDTAKEAGAGHWAMCEKAATGAFARSIPRCSGCGNEIDPETCWCGDDVAAHHMGSGHSPVPIGLLHTTQSRVA